MSKKQPSINWLYVLFGAVGLGLVYIFQDELFYQPPFTDPYSRLYDIEAMDKGRFVMSKLVRYFLNDSFALFIIVGLFRRRKYIRFAMLVFLFGFVVLVPIYLILTIYFYGPFASYLNHIHRLVMNPVLMMLLIPAFYYQRSVGK
ncbi:MAG: exosortase F system-associated protein [Bacteroidota bacterium]|nr:exosortase F system-associated protein [Bacteroidota bacterium]MDX5427222.1 exosortase F system-associated protein [Bacteroidota bacterium]